MNNSSLISLFRPELFDEDARHIARRQYQRPTDQHLGDVLARVATWVAQVEAEDARERWAAAFMTLMAEKKFCPGGRVLAGAGTNHGNVLNCFVQGATLHPSGSFEGVMEVARKLALVTKVGGGNGVNLDDLPQRREALPNHTVVVAFLSVTHPDVQQFVRCEVTPSSQPDGAKVPVQLRNIERVVLFGDEDAPLLSAELVALCREHGVRLLSRHDADQAYGLGTSDEPRGMHVGDSMEGIMDAAAVLARRVLERQPLAMLELSGMRAEGSLIKGSGGTSSGPVSFLAEIFDNIVTWARLGGPLAGPVATLRYVYAPVLRVVRQGGTRRGAGMATIRADHPDVLDFLTAKDLDREAAEGDISTFNISILVPDHLLALVEADEYLPVLAPLSEAPSLLHFPTGKYDVQALTDDGDVLFAQEQDGSYSNLVRAKWLLREISQHAHSTGEPGLIFVDRINEYSALGGLGMRYYIRSTNPCFAAGTEVLVRVGDDIRAEPIEALVGRTVEVYNGTAWQAVDNFRVTGENEAVYALKLRRGEETTTVYATGYHTFIYENGDRAKLLDLEVGDALWADAARVNNQAMSWGVEAIEFSHVADRVYCCTVEGAHSFVLANGLRVGNCGEIPLTVGEPCDLGAINLAAYVTRNELLEPTFDERAFRADIHTAVRFLDNVLDVNVFALEDNRAASQDLRRLGLGVMGLADALVKLGLAYDSPQGRDRASWMMGILRDEALAASEALGAERGVYPLYAQVNSAEQPEGRFAGAGFGGPIAHAPRRNVALLTVAPTGTTSMIMGVSGGLEPIYSPFVWRKIGSEHRAMLSPLFVQVLDEYLHFLPERFQLKVDVVTGEPVTGGEAEYESKLNHEAVVEALSEAHGSVQALDWVPQEVKAVFRFAHDVAPLDHVRMQGVVQRAFDAVGLAGNSLSKTINLPNSATVEDVEAAYLEAFRTGCKGITVYRDGSRQFQVLSTGKAAAPEAQVQVEARVAELEAQVAALEAQVVAARATAAAVGRVERPARLQGTTDMVKLTDPTSGARRTFLVTVNHDGVRPVEVLLSSGRAGEETNADSEALGRVVSIALQHGVPARALADTLRGINGGLYGSYESRLVGSKADLIAVALSTWKAPEVAAPEVAAVVAPVAAVAAPVGLGGAKCPVCEAPALVREEGCQKCLACGYAKCGG